MMVMTLEQARNAIDAVLQNVALKRSDHDLLRQALELLYDGAKENEETTRETVA